MAYEPRVRKVKPVWIIASIAVVFIMLLWFFFQFVLHDDAPKYSIGDLSYQKTSKLLSKSFDDVYEVSEYFYYGESLNILKEDYDAEKSDETSGKSLILKDLLSDQEYAFVLGSAVDRQVLLNRVKSGFYEMYLIEDLVERRITFDEAVNHEMKTIAREGGTRYLVNLIADKKFFEKQGISMDKNYAFLDVGKTSLDKEEYDIVLDPAAYDHDFTYMVNKGSEGNGLLEYKESYKACEKLKKELEKYGLKVLIVRDQEEEVDSYGEDGRLKRAYDAKAKYYFRVGFNESEYDYGGFDIVYSLHSSDYLAQQIIYQLSRLCDVEISEIYGAGGLIRDYAIEGQLDGRYVYDQDMWIRESGGKATQAGMFSENAKEGTGFFAKNNLDGMHSLTLSLGYLTNKADVDYWNQHFDEYMEALAKAMALSLHVIEE